MRISVRCSRADLAASRPAVHRDPKSTGPASAAADLPVVLEQGLPGSQHLADRVPRHPQVPDDLLDRLALEEMLAPNPANRVHCQHSPTTHFEPKREAHQAEWEGGNFERRYPRLRGQNCTPNNSRNQTCGPGQSAKDRQARRQFRDRMPVICAISSRCDWMLLPHRAIISGSVTEERRHIRMASE